MMYMPIRNQCTIKIEEHASNNGYYHDLQMYTVPPSGYINLEELQQLCIDRLKVLKLVEQISMQNYKKSDKEYIEILTKKLEKYGLHNFSKLINAPGCKSQGTAEQYLRRSDCASHFILRSAFSFEYEKRNWFLKQEIRLFKWRFSSLDKEGLYAFCHINKLHYTSISENEKQEIKEELENSCSDVATIENTKYYKIYFTNVMNLISKRQVFLKGGIAYIPDTKISSLIVPEFKKILIKGFAYSRLSASNLYGDERMTRILGVLPSCIRTQYFKNTNPKKVSLDELDELSRTSYPLCMRILHKALKTNHHLTNGGRVQYCLFLKGIGLKLDDAFQFWKGEFTKRIDESMFRKEYSYHIRHLYGVEGKRANYDPLPCFKIFNFNIGLRDNHGCPFKCMAFDILKKTLSECGMNQPDIESVVQLSKEGSYLKACKKYYEANHNCTIENTFDHPNVYFNHSRKVIKNMCSDKGN